MTYRTEWYAGVVTALSSISHIDPVERAGQSTKSYLRREKFIQPDGSVESVPTISGNGMRGLLRDRGMWWMCQRLGYGVDQETGEVIGLSLPAFHFLFSGGTLTKVGGRSLDISAAREIREMIPMVSLFGGALGNQIMQGKLKVGKMIPICQETAHVLPDWCHNGDLVSFYEYVQEETFTRKDDEKNEHLRQLIAPDVRGLLESARQDKLEKAGQPDSEVGQHQQMRYQTETLAAGTRLFWELALEDVTPLEYDAFWSCLVAFREWPFIGGRSGTGHGKVAINFQDWVAIDPNAMQTDKLDVPLGTRYETHLKEQAASIREILETIQ